MQTRTKENTQTMYKQDRNFIVIEHTELGKEIFLLKLKAQDDSPLPPMQAGQFVQVAVPGGHTLLRRPISICNYIEANKELWLLIARVGRGTRAILDRPLGSTLNIILPLGNGFGIEQSQQPLLVGGGVGIAPMFYLAQSFMTRGIRPKVVLGGRSSEHIVLRSLFEPIAELHITTDDGSLGLHGRVTDHEAIISGTCDAIYCCGPHPMMYAIAQIAEQRNIYCEVSLENTMACGIGVCLCCVQETKQEGNICVCTEGPVFNSQAIKW